MLLFGLLQLVELRELDPRRDGVPQPNGGVAGGRVDQHRAEEAVLASVSALHVHRRHAVAAGVDHFLVLGPDVVVGGFVGDGLIDEGRIQADLLK